LAISFFQKLEKLVEFNLKKKSGRKVTKFVEKISSANEPGIGYLEPGY
jgi:hypothetical protein